MAENDSEETANIAQARLLLQSLAASHQIRARQLYHDREEITVAVVPNGSRRSGVPSAGAKQPRSAVGASLSREQGSRADSGKSSRHKGTPTGGPPAPTGGAKRPNAGPKPTDRRRSRSR